MAELDFYFDVVSPYAYLAWWRARQANIALTPRPVLLSALLAHWGNRGPAEIPSKRTTMVRDVMRRAANYGAPLAWPPRHPFSTVAAARLVLAVTEPARRATLVDALFAAVWVNGAAIDEANVLQACADAAGLTATERNWALSSEAKAGLYAANAAAIKAGVLGCLRFAMLKNCCLVMIKYQWCSLNLLELIRSMPCTLTLLPPWHGQLRWCLAVERSATLATSSMVMQRL